MFLPRNNIDHKILFFTYFSQIPLTQTWNGIYPITTNGASEVFLNPLKDVYIINGVGGAGMTMSFGLAEELVGGM